MGTMRDEDSQVDAEVQVARSGIDTFSPAALRRRRAERALTLSDLSILSGVSESAISAWERGQDKPTPALLAAIATALGTHIADLAPVPESALRLVDLRHQAGYSQEHAAADLHISRTRLGAIESGRREPRVSEADALAALYGVTADRVLQLWQRTRDARTARLLSR
jgi:transcriptional regulator with XRE-family HTH domain